MSGQWIKRIYLGLLGALWIGGAFAQEAAITHQGGFGLAGTTANQVDGVLGMDTNPAALGMIRSWEFVGGYTGQGRQSAGALATGFRLFGPFSFGFGTHIGDTGATRLGGVFALGDDAFSLGFQVWGMAGKTQLTDSSSTGLDLGLTLRPAWWMALSSTLKNANGPHVDGNAQGAVGTIDLGIRPYWERLTLGAGLVVPVDESDRWHPRFQLTTRLLNGFHFGGSLTRGDSVDASGERADEWTTGFHLGVDFSDTMSVFGGWSTPPGEATQVQTAIRFSGEEHAPLLSRTGTWAKVNLATLSELSLIHIPSPRD